MTTTFKRRAAASFADPYLRKTLARVLSKLRQAPGSAPAHPEAFGELQAAAREARARALADLPRLLAQLEAQLTAQGAEVHWAEDARAANRIILALAQRAGGQRREARVVKCHSSTAEEIGLREALEAASLPVVETQLGDYILQLGNETPAHPVYPALHKRKEDVAVLFEEQLDMPQTLSIQAMASMARFKLRRELLQADLGIVGVNFAVAETGTLAVLTSSGNDRLLGATVPRQVALMGVDKVVATLDDLVLLERALVASASGRQEPVSLSLFNGPARPEDPDGPDELHVIILDNGRSQLMGLGYGEALACIGCGACLNVCPVYQEVGGQAYGPSQAGPIGSVRLPLLPEPPGEDDARGLPPRRGGQSDQPGAPPSPLQHTPFADLPYASTLCGACAEACPVGIDIPSLLVSLRRDLATQGRVSRSQSLARRAYAWCMASPGRYRRAGTLLASLGRLLGSEYARHLPPPLRGWTRQRDFALPARKSFRERWTER